MEEQNERKVTIRKCQRCGNDHVGLEMRPLHNPVDRFKYFAICPELNEPIVIAIVGKVDKKPK